MNLFFFKYDSKNWIFDKNDSKNWIFFFWKKIFLKELIFLWLKGLNFFRCKELNLFFFLWIWLKELNLFLLDSKIWCYSFWPKELNFFWLGLTELDPFLEYDSENWNFSWVFLHVYFFQKWCRELNLSLNMTQRIEPFSYLKQRNELLFLWYEWLQELFFQTKNTQWIELFEIWLKELNIWTMCQKKTQRVELF